MDRGYETMGRMHAGVLTRATRGQGTVEYVGLILLIAVVMAGVLKASDGMGDKSIPTAVMAKLKEAIGDVKGK